MNWEQRLMEALAEIKAIAIEAQTNPTDGAGAIEAFESIQRIVENMEEA